nr:hypothetical protein TetV2_00619 [Oceanusvirus sp.]
MNTSSVGAAVAATMAGLGGLLILVGIYKEPQKSKSNKSNTIDKIDKIDATTQASYVGLPAPIASTTNAYSQTSNMSTVPTHNKQIHKQPQPELGRTDRTPGDKVLRSVSKNPKKSPDNKQPKPELGRTDGMPFDEVPPQPELGRTDGKSTIIGIPFDKVLQGKSSVSEHLGLSKTQAHQSTKSITKLKNQLSISIFQFKQTIVKVYELYDISEEKQYFLYQLITALLINNSSSVDNNVSYAYFVSALIGELIRMFKSLSLETVSNLAFVYIYKWLADDSPRNVSHITSILKMYFFVMSGCRLSLNDGSITFNDSRSEDVASTLKVMEQYLDKNEENTSVVFSVVRDCGYILKDRYVSELANLSTKFGIPVFQTIEPNKVSYRETIAQHQTIIPDIPITEYNDTVERAKKLPSATDSTDQLMSWVSNVPSEQRQDDSEAEKAKAEAEAARIAAEEEAKAKAKTEAEAKEAEADRIAAEAEEKAKAEAEAARIAAEEEAKAKAKTEAEAKEAEADRIAAEAEEKAKAEAEAARIAAEAEAARIAAEAEAARIAAEAEAEEAAEDGTDISQLVQDINRQLPDEFIVAITPNKTFVFDFEWNLSKVFDFDIPFKKSVHYRHVTNDSDGSVDPIVLEIGFNSYILHQENESVVQLRIDNGALEFVEVKTDNPNKLTRIDPPESFEFISLFVVSDLSVVIVMSNQSKTEQTAIKVFSDELVEVKSFNDFFNTFQLEEGYEIIHAQSDFLCVRHDEKPSKIMVEDDDGYRDQFTFGVDVYTVLTFAVVDGCDMDDTDWLLFTDSADVHQNVGGPIQQNLVVGNQAIKIPDTNIQNNTITMTIDDNINIVGFKICSDTRVGGDKIGTHVGTALLFSVVVLSSLLQ